MKLKATRKEIENNFTEIFLIDKLHGFLPRPFAYNCGVYSWNWDACELEGICFVYGNRSFPRYKRMPESAVRVLAEYERVIRVISLDEILFLIEEYKAKFIETLKNA